MLRPSVGRPNKQRALDEKLKERGGLRMVVEGLIRDKQATYAEIVDHVSGETATPISVGTLKRLIRKWDEEDRKAGKVALQA